MIDEFGRNELFSFSSSVFNVDHDLNPLKIKFSEDEWTFIANSNSDFGERVLANIRLSNEGFCVAKKYVNKSANHSCLAIKKTERKENKQCKNLDQFTSLGSQYVLLKHTYASTIQHVSFFCIFLSFLFSSFFSCATDWNMVCVVRWICERMKVQWIWQNTTDRKRHPSPLKAKGNKNQQYAAYSHRLRSENDTRTKWMKTNRIGEEEKIVLALCMFCSFAFFSLHFVSFHFSSSLKYVAFWSFD